MLKQRGYMDPRSLKAETGHRVGTKISEQPTLIPPPVLIALI